MNLSTSQFRQPQEIGSTASDGVRNILAVVDLDAPVESVIYSAVAVSVANAAPLEVVVLYRCPGFTTDPALAARMACWLDDDQRRVMAAVRNAARSAGFGAYELRLVPLSRFPLGNRAGQARRAVAALLRQEPSSLVVAAAHLTARHDGSPLTPGPWRGGDV